MEHSASLCDGWCSKKWSGARDCRTDPDDRAAYRAGKGGFIQRVTAAALG